jgi:hypothetical protein
MRWLAVLGVVFGAYYYFLTHTADIVMRQLQHIQAQYSYAADHAGQLATGR